MTLEPAPLLMTGPVVIFGGPYSNLQATQSMLEQAARRGIPPDHIICTGDLVAYCGNPRETIAAVRASGIRVVMGNCDEQLALGATDCACGYPAGSACDLMSAQWYGYANSQLDDVDRAWLAGLPKRIDIVIGERRLAVIHGSVSTINAYVFASTPKDVLAAELALAGTDGVIGGHSGLPFTRLLDGRIWHNAGVIGMPANDGTTLGWYSVITQVRAGLHIEHCSFAYDYKAAAAAMAAADLPEAYAVALGTGIWPSNDVLPPAERSIQGLPQMARSLTWLSSAPVALVAEVAAS